MKKKRIEALDCVRGLAILGIFLLNISGFGLPFAAYLNPVYVIQPSQSDLWVWSVLNVFAQGKFLCIFALLFGATLEILRKYSLERNFARLFVLGIIGLLHSALLWSGDILLMYSLSGMLACYLISRWNNNGLLLASVLFILFGLFILFFFMADKGVLTLLYWQPTNIMVEIEKELKLAGGLAGIEYRLSVTQDMLQMLVLQYGWQLAGTMLLGAFLMRNGWLKGWFSQQHYKQVVYWILVPSVCIQIMNVMMQAISGWSLFWLGGIGYIIYELITPLQSIGYIALIYTLWPKLAHHLWTKWLRHIGRMALSNSLLQSIIGVTLFHYFGLFNHFDRLTLLLFVPPVWCANILFSTVWLRSHSQGPIESLWRKASAKLINQDIKNT